MKRRNDSGSGLLGVGCLGALIGAALWVGIIYVVVHFIQKYW